MTVFLYLYYERKESSKRRESRDQLHLIDAGSRKNLHLIAATYLLPSDAGLRSTLTVGARLGRL
jgi:hypothetical protein